MHSKLYHQQRAHFFKSAIEYDRPPFFTAPNLDINEQSHLLTTNQERWAAATKEYQTAITDILRDHHHSQILQEADDIEHEKSIILQVYPNFINDLYAYSCQRALDRLHQETKTVGGHKDNRTTDAELTAMPGRTMTITDTNTNMTDMINPTHATTVTGTLKEDEETHKTLRNSQAHRNTNTQIHDKHFI